MLEQLYDDNSGHLEAEADEENQVGSRFLDHQEKVKVSADGGDGALGLLGSSLQPRFPSPSE